MKLYKFTELPEEHQKELTQYTSVEEVIKMTEGSYFIVDGDRIAMIPKVVK